MNRNDHKSNYIRGKVFGNHEKLQQLSSLPDSLVIAPEHADETAALMDRLRNKYPNHHTSALFKASLSLALENENRIVANKLKNHL